MPLYSRNEQLMGYVPAQIFDVVPDQQMAEPLEVALEELARRFIAELTEASRTRIEKLQLAGEALGFLIATV